MAPCIFVVLLGSALLVSQASAETQYKLSGVVRDGSAQAIANATVAVVNEETNQQASVATANDGSYEFTLPAGRYTVEAQKITFGTFQTEARAVIEGLAITSDQVEDFTMLGSHRAIVHVTDAKGGPVAGARALLPATSTARVQGETPQGTPVRLEGVTYSGPSCETDAEGECTIVVFAGTQLQVRVEKPGQLSVTVERKIDSEPTEIAVQLSAANEPPNFGRCQKVSKGSGLYDDAGCVTLGGRRLHEWFPGVPSSGFTISAASLKLEAVTKTALRCEGVSGGGSYAGTKHLESVVLTLTGCTLSGKACSSSGAAPGEVRSNRLAGALRWREKATKSVALELSRAEQPLLSFNCTGTQVDVTGSVLVPVKADKMMLTPSLPFSAKKGVQAFAEYEAPSGKVLAVLAMRVNGGPSTQAGLTTKLVVRNEEPVEISTSL